MPTSSRQSRELDSAAGSAPEPHDRRVLETRDQHRGAAGADRHIRRSEEAGDRVGCPEPAEVGGEVLEAPCRRHRSVSGAIEPQERVAGQRADVHGSAVWAHRKAERALEAGDIVCRAGAAPVTRCLEAPRRCQHAVGSAVEPDDCAVRERRDVHGGPVRAHCHAPDRVESRSLVRRSHAAAVEPGVLDAASRCERAAGRTDKADDRGIDGGRPHVDGGPVRADRNPARAVEAGNVGCGAGAAAALPGVLEAADGCERAIGGPVELHDGVIVDRGHVHGAAVRTDRHGRSTVESGGLVGSARPAAVQTGVLEAAGGREGAVGSTVEARHGIVGRRGHVHGSPVGAHRDATGPIEAR